MQIKTCQNYHAVSSSTKLAQMPDGKSIFKIYYISIIGRDKPELYEWDNCLLTQAAYYSRFLSGTHTGMGFATAFPHITKVFRFSPTMETNMDVKIFDSPSLTPIPYPRDEDDYLQFACYAEAIIAAEEFRAWAKASSVEEYLKHFCHTSDFPVKTNCKLKEYWK
jgi:hypothetical protein